MTCKKILRYLKQVFLAYNFYFKYAINTYAYTQQNFSCCKQTFSFERRREKNQKVGYNQKPKSQNENLYVQI